MNAAALDWDAVGRRLDTAADAIAALRRGLSPTRAGDRSSLGRAHAAFVAYSIQTAARYPGQTLRPLARDAAFVDMPTQAAQAFAETQGDGAWSDAIPDYKDSVTNLIANEDWAVLEWHGSGKVRNGAPLGAPDARVGTKLELDYADVIALKGGAISRVERYYDLATILRTLGVLPAIPMGHDERSATPPPVLHASGFARDLASLRTRERPRTRPELSVGSGQTQTAQTNRANCSGIHEAFITHDPNRFNKLIAEDAVWIDVPTGEVLNGALAAAHHDHGNWMRAFPDSSAEVTNLIANDAWCCVQHRGFGHHLGQLELGGKTYPPTGRPVELRVLDIVRYQDGKAVLIRNYYDMAAMLLQLGVMQSLP